MYAIKVGQVLVDRQQKPFIVMDRRSSDEIKITQLYGDYKTNAVVDVDYIHENFTIYSNKLHYILYYEA